MHRKIFAVILAGVLSLLTLTACGTSEFGMTENTEKRMVITAERAAKDDFFLVGSLKVDEGEQITISSDLEKGSVRVEIFRWGEEQDADTLPETGGSGFADTAIGIGIAGAAALAVLLLLRKRRGSCV